MLMILLDFFLSHYIEQVIKKKLVSLNATASSVNVNIFSRSLTIKELEWNWSTNKASLFPKKVFAKQVNVKGIGWMPLFFSETLIIKQLSFDGGLIEFNMRVRRNKIRHNDSSFTSFSFDQLSLQHIKASVVNDTSGNDGETVYLKTGNKFLNTFYSLNVSEAMANKLHIDWPDAMYTGTVHQVRAMSRGGRMIVDSIDLTPNRSKLDFGKGYGRQVSRIELRVPQLTVEGLHLQEIFNNMLIIPKLHIESFQLQSFRDKRLAIVQFKDRTMPMESFRKMPFGIRIDSITIGHSTIIVEEFPETGIASSAILFDQIEATCTGVNNRIFSTIPVSAVLKANGQLMKSGNIQTVIELPLNAIAEYTARGSISNIDLITLNPTLQNMDSLQVQSCYLHNLNFQFGHNDLSAHGWLNITFENFSLAENSNQIIRNKASKSLRLANSNVNYAKHTTLKGVINLERDRKKWIFSLWSKSIQDGINSCMESGDQQSLTKRNAR
jgi:hypothetical protein